MSITDSRAVCLQFMKKGQHTSSGSSGEKEVVEIVQVSENGMDVSNSYMTCRMSPEDLA